MSFIDKWNAKLLEKANCWAINNRLSLIDLYKSIFRYCFNNNLVFGGNLSVNLTINKEDKDNFNFVVYGKEIFSHANNITNIIHKITKNDNLIVMLKTVMPFEIYYIRINTRLLIELKDIKQVRGVDPIFMISPVKKKFLRTDIFILSPEVQLISIYRKLYLPCDACDWDKLLLIETKLVENLNIRQKKIAGSKDLSLNVRKKINDSIVDLFKNNDTKIFIGEMAINQILHPGKKKTEVNIIEVISSSHEYDDVYLIKNHLLNKFGDVFINSQTSCMFIIDDFRLKRTTFKFIYKGKKKDFLYIYNSAKYDLIPYTKYNKILIASPFVILRFVLINIWIIRWISQLNNIDETFSRHKINYLLSMFYKLRNKLFDGDVIDERNINSDRLLSVFQKRYIGTFVSDVFAQKMELFDKKKFGDYYPALYQQQFGKYRII
jgi:hypothetical protein